MPKRKKNIRVMVYGTFDILHPGHVHFLNQAKRLGDFLIVSVSRDINARRFKGADPVFSERDRLLIVSSLAMVDRAVLGGNGYYLPHTLKEKPDIIALGYDQTAYENHLRADIRAGKLRVRLVRLKPYREKKHKSTLYKTAILEKHA